MADSKPLTYWNSFPPAGVTPSGSPVEPVYKEVAPGKLEKVGERNLQDEYNKAAVGVTPYEIFDRCVKTGDLSSLADYADQGGEPVDVSGLPDNLADANGVIGQGEAAAAALNAELKAKEVADLKAKQEAEALAKVTAEKAGEVKK